MGKLVISKIDHTIGVSKDFRDMSKGEILHFIGELEIAKNDLIKKFNSL